MQNGRWIQEAVKNNSQRVGGCLILFALSGDLGRVGYSKYEESGIGGPENKGEYTVGKMISVFGLRQDGDYWGMEQSNGQEPSSSGSFPLRYVRLASRRIHGGRLLRTSGLL